jgi:hypothetical protein
MLKQGAYYNLYQAQARNVDVDMDDGEQRSATRKKGEDEQ